MTWLFEIEAKTKKELIKLIELAHKEGHRWFLKKEREENINGVVEDVWYCKDNHYLNKGKYLK